MANFDTKTGRAIGGRWSGTTPPSTCEEGEFYIKTNNPLGQRLGTCSSSGTWEFPSGSSAVSSVFSRTGAVIAQANDYAWNDIASKPSTFAPSAHSHPQSDVTNLVTDLAGKAASSHTHAESEITSLVSDLAGKQATLGFTPENSANKGAISGYASLDAGTKIPIAQIPTGSTASTVAIGNDARLSDARTPLSHSHAESEITNLVTDLAGKASSTHTHAEADITNLVTDLAGKQAALGFTPENSANKGAANGYAPLNASSRVPIANLASGTPDGTKFIRDDGTLVTPSGGSDPWVYVKLASDFVTSSATAVDVTGMTFTPVANLSYEISGIFLLRTATTTVGPRTGVAWPTGMTDGVVVLRVESAAGTQVISQGNINAAVLAPVGGLPTNTQSYPGELRGLLRAGATPSGTFRLQLASETAGTNVTMKAGSFLRYRII